MKQQKLQISYLLLAALLGTSCSNENDPITPIDKTDAIELGITAGVSLTKSAITGGSSAQTGTGSDQIKSIAVYAKGAGSSYTGDNNYALYTYGSNWVSGTDKIYLTNEDATIYGYHPAYEPDGTDHYMKEVGDGGNALKVTSFSATSTININVFQGKDDAGAGGTVKTKSTISATPVASEILSALGEVDYMWAIDGSSSNSGGANKQPTASNGKKTGEPTQDAHKVSLQMKHALAMVSFSIYKDDTYKNTGTLTKIVLKNKSTSPASDIVLATYETMTMKIADGTIKTGGTKAAATYTRFIGTIGTAIVAAASKESAPKYSILVLPDGDTKFDKNKVQVVFTIDGADYSVDLTDPSSDEGKWLSGKNYLYTAKLSGKELSLTSVTVAAWTDGTTGGDLNVN